MTTFEAMALIAKKKLLPMPYQKLVQENSSDPEHANTTPPTTGTSDRYTRVSIVCPRTIRDANAEKRGSIALITCANPIEFDDRQRIVQS